MTTAGQGFSYFETALQEVRSRVEEVRARVEGVRTGVIDGTMHIARFAATKINELKDAFAGEGQPDEPGAEPTFPKSHIEAFDELRRNKPVQYRRMVNLATENASASPAELAQLWMSLAGGT
jgi:hypothetical protein